ncbi:argininosuccinate lyase [Catalinimonas alkaloidigena]|uniref:Argininosuccinate lyase n=1 Tax=Catalinimonas alkaloidigena TaxID=1075417 RepID=A0A1G9T3U0_9BACT|nr:argininosuccinate lyase [Catalinimonas alkaloidigena]SDM42320.1 argininosuccinate lyase [Catalinimonas alkaloidigena]
MKLWDKGTATHQAIEQFTVGRDREMDLYLAPWDVLGTLAHIRMLQSIGLLTQEELGTLTTELRAIHRNIEAGEFAIEEGIEDVHSQVELMLTRKLGDMGKKVHSGRSRNDQVLVDLKLFIRGELRHLVQDIRMLFNRLIILSEKHRQVLLPGYTHFQVAMPSSFGLWFGAYAESLTDDLQLLLAAYRINDQNPLGSAAGYGSSFPLNRQMTTDLLGFERLNWNVVYAQMGRGKVERTVAFALASLGGTLARLAMDATLYMSQNFGFISFPDELTTGSSIMPHKKNPDVWELIRARGNRLQALPNEIGMLTANLPSGYHRDLQLVKESFIPSFADARACLQMCDLMLENIRVRTDILDDDRYRYLFSVEEVNKEVLSGVPFRDAYKKVGQAIANGQFNPEKTVHHTHEGSIGNPGNDPIAAKMDALLHEFHFERSESAERRLLTE